MKNWKFLSAIKDKVISNLYFYKEITDWLSIEVLKDARNVMMDTFLFMATLTMTTLVSIVLMLDKMFSVQFIRNTQPTVEDTTKMVDH